MLLTHCVSQASNAHSLFSSLVQVDCAFFERLARLAANDVGKAKVISWPNRSEFSHSVHCHAARLQTSPGTDSGHHGDVTLATIAIYLRSPIGWALHNVSIILTSLLPSQTICSYFEYYSGILSLTESYSVLNYKLSHLKMMDLKVLKLNS